MKNRIFKVFKDPSLSFICLLAFFYSNSLHSEEEDFRKYAMFASNAERPKPTSPIPSKLPFTLQANARIALIGNTLFDRMRNFGHFEAMLQKAHPNLNLVVRNLAWSADEIDLQPRPANFADTEQHLTAMKADIIIAAFGYNESFGGRKELSSFENRLANYLLNLGSKSYNGKSAPLLVLVSPIANENVAGVSAANLNNDNIMAYCKSMKKVADKQKVGFVNVFGETASEMLLKQNELTINGAHLNALGYSKFAKILFKGIFQKEAPSVDKDIRAAVIEKNKTTFLSIPPTQHILLHRRKKRELWLPRFSSCYEKF